MDDLDQLLSDLHKNKGERPKRRSTRQTTAKPAIDFNELDDLMAQFAEVLGETTPKSSAKPSSAIPISTFAAEAAAAAPRFTAPKTAGPSTKSYIDFDGLKFGKLIGKGNFGAVYEGTYNGGKVAIKELYDRGDTNVEKYYQREIEMLSVSRHVNIVNFLGVAKGKDGKVYVVTEFCEGDGDLHHLCKTTDMPWEKRVGIALGVAKAVAYLHGKGIIHRDLKCENVLLTSDGTPKLCDFGFARPMESDAKKHMTMVGTDWTMAPEILLSMDYTEKVDVFSFGMMLCELISRISPNATNFKRTLPGFGVDPAEIRSKANAGAPPGLVDLTIRCTKDDPADRPNMTDIIKILTTIQDALFDEFGSDEALKLMEAELANLHFSAPGSAVVQETKTVTAITSEVDKNDKDAVTDDLEGVYVRRKLIQMENFDKFVYAVENTRLHDVVLTIEIEGENAKMLPAGQATGFLYKKVEGVIPTGAQVVFATVEPMNPNERLAFSAQMGVDRIDTEVRFTELQGVFLNTHITHGKTTEISFEIYNKKKDNDVEVELEVVGGPLLEGSSDMPIKSLVRKGEKKTIGMVRAQQTVGTNWIWRPIVTHPDEVSVVNGVTLRRRHVGGKTFELEVHNPRSTSIQVEINFTGTGAANITPNPAQTILRPGATEVVITTALSGQLGMDWKWQEKV